MYLQKGAIVPVSLSWYIDKYFFKNRQFLTSFCLSKKQYNFYKISHCETVFTHYPVLGLELLNPSLLPLSQNPDLTHRYSYPQTSIFRAMHYFKLFLLLIFATKLNACIHSEAIEGLYSRISQINLMQNSAQI